MPRKATGTGLFSDLTCLHSTSLILLSILSVEETISLKIWERPLSWRAKCFRPRLKIVAFLFLLSQDCGLDMIADFKRLVQMHISNQLFTYALASITLASLIFVFFLLSYVTIWKVTLNRKFCYEWPGSSLLNGLENMAELLSVDLISKN